MPTGRFKPTVFLLTIRRAVTFLVTLGLTAALTATGYRTVTPVRAVAATPGLRCFLRTEPGRPISFTPEVNAFPRRVTASGSALLDQCSSGTGEFRDIASGRLVIRGDAVASCSQATRLRGCAARGGSPGTPLPASAGEWWAVRCWSRMRAAGRATPRWTRC